MSHDVTQPKFPSPGNGYEIRERIGAGTWKVAYRASSLNSLSDRAILYYHDGSAHEQVVKDFNALFRTQAEHRYKSYLAELYGVFLDSAGKFYIVEELLSRPLDRIGRIRDYINFLKIARDLCRGLVAIHDSNLVHRDLKLDNCGLDPSGKAKIFDLGCVTSEDGDLRGTILTRAPEFFIADDPTKVKFRPASDIWALGATLFALRTGEYPFVPSIDAARRSELNGKVTSGEMTKDEADIIKKEIDSKIARRVIENDAQEKLFARASSEFRGETLEIMRSMLQFDCRLRPSAAELAGRWNARVSDISSGTSKSVTKSENEYQSLLQFVQSAARGEIEITRKMLETVTNIYERKKISFSALEEIEFKKEINLLSEMYLH